MVRRVLPGAALERCVNPRQKRCVETLNGQVASENVCSIALWNFVSGFGVSEALEGKGPGHGRKYSGLFWQVDLVRERHCKVHQGSAERFLVFCSGY